MFTRLPRIGLSKIDRYHLEEEERKAKKENKRKNLERDESKGLLRYVRNFDLSSLTHAPVGMVAS